MHKKITHRSTKLLPAPPLLRSKLKAAGPLFWFRLTQLITPTHLLAISAGVYIVLSTAFTASFFWPRSVDFSFARENCFTSPTLLPNLIAKNQGETFTATPAKSIAVAGYPLYSHATCVTPAQAPEEKAADRISFSPLGISLLKKNIRVSTGELPSVDYKTALSQPVATKDPLVFPLSSADLIFDYQLLANSQKSPCTKENRLIICDTSKLELEQSASYNFVMQRLFDGQPGKTVFEQTAATVGAAQLIGSSIGAGQTVYDVPAQIVLTFNKKVKSFSGVALNLVSGETRQATPITYSSAGATVTIGFEQPLARNSSFELSIQNLSAPDGGHLPAPLVLPFATSGGPKVKSAGIGSYKVSTGGNIVITFDSNVSAAQNLGDFIKLEINGSAVPATISVSGNRVTINPASDLPKCTNFTIRVLDGLKNEAGISGGSAWTYGSRTICQTIFSIGTSVQGRGITAYRFGSGGSYVVFVGGTHGNEKSSTYTLNSWIDYLERNPNAIPGHRTIVIIPNLNPDGYAITQRTNANNVDLNRNFPADDWKQGVTMPGGSFNPNGGGSAPLSEPESSALANYVLSVDPRLVLTYHAAAGVVIPNDAGDSGALAQVYDQKSNLNYSSGAGLFNYDTTGAFEDWLLDKHNITAILVELWTKSGNEFTKNQNAMLHMANLP